MEPLMSPTPRGIPPKRGTEEGTRELNLNLDELEE